MKLQQLVDALAPAELKALKRIVEGKEVDETAPQQEILATSTPAPADPELVEKANLATLMYGDFQQLQPLVQKANAVIGYYNQFEGHVEQTSEKTTPSVKFDRHNPFKLKISWKSPKVEISLDFDRVLRENGIFKTDVGAENFVLQHFQAKPYGHRCFGYLHAVYKNDSWTTKYYSLLPEQVAILNFCVPLMTSDDKEGQAQPVAVNYIPGNLFWDETMKKFIIA